MKHRVYGMLLRMMPSRVEKALRKWSGRPGVVERPKESIVPSQQDLGVYWDEQFADDVSEWGRGNTWDEILLLMAARRGKVLDIACGTGVNIADLSRGNGLDVYGCDISDLLIKRAVSRGIPATRLTVCNATKMPYPDECFDYGYSIGSLEHFDVKALEACIRECRRVVSGTVFHMVPVSRTGTDEGWIRRQQSFYNNSVEWWLARFKTAYDSVDVLASRWEDDISIGKWFVCRRDGVAHD